MAASNISFRAFNMNSAGNMTAVWSFIPTFTLVNSIVNVFLNGCVLLLFLTERHLQTPFAIYLINLLIVNLACNVMQSPVNIITTLYSSWTVINQSVCTMYLYGTSVVSGGMMFSHALITANRIWAIAFPISYRTYHSKRTAIFTVFGLWIYIHLLQVRVHFARVLHLPT